MKKKLIFKKLVEGYKTKLRWESANSGHPSSINVAAPSFPSGPLEIKGEVSIKEEKKKGFGVSMKGIQIPELESGKSSKFGIKEGEEQEYLNLVYPLIPESPGSKDPIMAYAKIKWNPTENSHEYVVVQPEVTERMKKLTEKIKEILEEKLDVEFNKLKKREAREYLQTQTLKLLDYFGIKLSENEKNILCYYIERDFLGLGLIEPLMHDENIEDISCDGVDIPIYVFHRNPRLGSVATNIVFKKKEQLDSFLMRLAQLCGQSVSVLDPLLQGTLPDGSRIQGTLSTDIARRGSNFTIRKFSKVPLTATQLLDYKTVDIKTLAFLWLAVDYGCSALVSGGTASGKTSFLNVLSSFIKPNMKIVSIEDTSELKLLHKHWLPQVARTSISTDKGKERGQVDLFDLLKESLRQRPDYIILGEVRGKEAFVLFQQMATGHPSYATIHADTMEKLIDRLTSPPIDLPPSLIENLDLIVFLSKLRYRGKFTRRLKGVYEVTGFDRKDNVPTTNCIFEWDAQNDKIDTKNKSVTLRKIIKRTGFDEKELLEELKRRMAVLQWLHERQIVDYKTVAQVIESYYNYPDKVIDIINGEV